MKKRRKGYNSEHELEKLLNEAGVRAKRIPMSGQGIHRGDILLNVERRYETINPSEPDRLYQFKTFKEMIGEVKAWENNFFEYELLESADLVFKRTIRKGKTKDFLVVMPLKTFIGLVKK